MGCFLNKEKKNKAPSGIWSGKLGFIVERQSNVRIMNV